MYNFIQNVSYRDRLLIMCSFAQMRMSNRPNCMPHRSSIKNCFVQ